LKISYMGRLCVDSFAKKNRCRLFLHIQLYEITEIIFI
jgi:hypothetical protein